MKKIIAVILTLSFITAMLCSCAKNPDEDLDESPTGDSASSSEFLNEPDNETNYPPEPDNYDEPQSSSATKPTEKPTNTTQTVTDKPTGTTQTVTERKIVKVTIPEGYSFMQIANTLESKGVCTAKDFYKAAQEYKVKSFTIPSNSNRCFKLEGYLFPDTYEFYTKTDPETVIRKMLNNYAAKSGMPSDETLILASIIEKETRSTDHMKMVSSVFHNRLDKNMQLQADSTRDYVNKYITGNKLLSNTGKFAPLYNTYKCAALPAGPICNPGKRAIEAAKNPSSSEYLYFFFGNDNNNHYSKTDKEHQEQMDKYGVNYGR